MYNDNDRRENENLDGNTSDNNIYPEITNSGNASDEVTSEENAAPATPPENAYTPGAHAPAPEENRNPNPGVYYSRPGSVPPGAAYPPPPGSVPPAGIPPHPYMPPQDHPSSERSEIVYVTDKRGTEYNAHYVTPPSPEKKKKSDNFGLKLTAIILASVLGVVILVLAGIAIVKYTDIFDRVRFHDRFGDRNESYYEDDIKDDESVTEDTDNSDNADGKTEDSDEVFQMNVPATDKDNSEIEETETVKPGTPLTVNQIAKKCTKSSVGIMVETTEYYFGREYIVSGVGSGFILSEDGYIATNNHVVGNATKITVVLSDGVEYDAVLVGGDSVTDIAVVKIDAKDLPVMERGNSDDILVGDIAVAIGTPASIELAGTVTDGIISAVDRKIDITDNSGRVIKTMTLIQTNATINPGNSGGPLINQYGQVIGINTMKLTDEYEGIGFAIPINGAISIMNQLISDGEVYDRSDGLVTGNTSIGIECVDVTEDEAEYYGIPRGVLVMQINKTGSAAKAGLRRGDIIIAFDGVTVKTTEEINTIKNKHNVGDEVTLTVFREGDGNIDITFTLDMQAQ